MNRASSALQFISPVERETWVQMGMALQSEFGDAARDIWTEWSRQANSFNEMSARSVWKSFYGTGVTIATLFHEARQNGWRDEGFQKPTAAQIDAQRQASAERASKEGRERARMAAEAARKAAWIVGQCKSEKHAYLHSKGFPDLAGLVWRPEPENNLLCIPMSVSGNLCGLQMIDREGGKKFLSGQIASQAEHRMDAGGGLDFWVEGYASGLSLQACLNALKLRYRIHITFSAQNLKRMAHSGFIVADNDASGTGLKAATETNLPFWIPEITGNDINDVHVKNGTFRTSQMLGKWLKQLREEQEWNTG